MKQIMNGFTRNIVNAVIASGTKQSRFYRNQWIKDCFVAITPRNDILRGFRNSNYGFTLIEAVIIIVILIVIAAVAIPRIVDVTSTKAAATAEKIKSDIRYAQELAMTRNQRYRVYFNTAPAPASGYAVVNDADGDANWGEAGEFAQDPAIGGDLSVTLNTGDYAGITVTSTVNPIEFNSLGRPTGGETTVTVSPGSYTLTISAETGAVN